MTIEYGRQLSREAELERMEQQSRLAQELQKKVQRQKFLQQIAPHLADINFEQQSGSDVEWDSDKLLSLRELYGGHAYSTPKHPGALPAFAPDISGIKEVEESSVRVQQDSLSMHTVPEYQSVHNLNISFSDLIEDEYCSYSGPKTFATGKQDGVASNTEIEKMRARVSQGVRNLPMDVREACRFRRDLPNLGWHESERNRADEQIFVTPELGCERGRGQPRPIVEKFQKLKMGSERGRDNVQYFDEHHFQAAQELSTGFDQNRATPREGDNMAGSSNNVNNELIRLMTKSQDKRTKCFYTCSSKINWLCSKAKRLLRHSCSHNKQVLSQALFLN